MNRHLVAAVITATTSLVATNAFASEPSPSEAAQAPASAEAPATPVGDLGDRMALHLAPVMTVPTGAVADGTGPGFGVFFGGEYKLSSRVSATGRVGYISWAQQERTVADFTFVSSIDTVPALGGIKFYVLEPQQGLFLAAELGAIYARGSVRVSGSAGSTRVNTTTTAAATNFGGALSAGYQAGNWDLRAGLLALDAEHVDSSAALMASVAYSFVQF